MNAMDLISPIKILIVEDNSLYKKVIIDFLSEYVIFKITGEAKDGQTAIRLAKELKPDMVIIDLGLPIISGIEATKIIKEANPSIKIIALSSHVNQDEAMESLAAGATAYVNKDIDLNQMKMIIETVNNGAIWISPIIGRKLLSEIIKNYKK